MRIRALLFVTLLIPLAACTEPLGKKAMISGCEASARAVAQDLRGAGIDYRAVVGREVVMRFEVPRQDGDPQPVSVKCKVDTGGRLQRIKIDGVRSSGEALSAARRAFDAAAETAAPAGH